MMNSQDLDDDETIVVAPQERPPQVKQYLDMLVDGPCPYRNRVGR